MTTSASIKTRKFRCLEMRRFAPRVRRDASLPALALALASLVGCGYSLGYRAPPSARTIGVPVFQNSTVGLQREVEIELTELVRRELQVRTPLRLVDSEHADLVLRGNILEFREDTVVEGRRDAKVESNVTAVVDLALEDYANGYKIARRVQGIEPFSPELGQSIDDVRRRALENLAERIVAAIEYWDDYDDLENDLEGEEPHAAPASASSRSGALGRAADGGGR